MAILAAQLLETIVAGSSIALRPLRPDASGLPDRISDRITDALEDSAFDAAGDRVSLKTRDLEAVYKALEELYEADVGDLLLQLWVADSRGA